MCLWKSHCFFYHARFLNTERSGEMDEGNEQRGLCDVQSKGLQKLRWYCQVCQKQCRDENGFQNHIRSESHLRNMKIVGNNPGKFIGQNSRAVGSLLFCLCAVRKRIYQYSPVQICESKGLCQQSVWLVLEPHLQIPRIHCR